MLWQLWYLFCLVFLSFVRSWPAHYRCLNKCSDCMFAYCKSKLFVPLCTARIHRLLLTVCVCVCLWENFPLLLCVSRVWSRTLLLVTTDSECSALTGAMSDSHSCRFVCFAVWVAGNNSDKTKSGDIYKMFWDFGGTVGSVLG